MLPCIVFLLHQWYHLKLCVDRLVDNRWHFFMALRFALLISLFPPIPMEATDKSYSLAIICYRFCLSGLCTSHPDLVLCLGVVYLSCSFWIVSFLILWSAVCLATFYIWFWMCCIFYIIPIGSILLFSASLFIHYLMDVVCLICIMSVCMVLMQIFCRSQFSNCLNGICCIQGDNTLLFKFIYIIHLY